MKDLAEAQLHYHHDCPYCSEEAIPERCPGYRKEWDVIEMEILPDEDEMQPNTARIWFKDWSYMDVLLRYAWQYENQPDWDHTEYIHVTRENGNTLSVTV